MAGNIKGITIEFRGDTTKLDKALGQINKETRKLDNELKKVDRALKFNPSSVELWRQKQTLLSDKISETEERLKVLKDAQKQMDAKSVDENSKEYRELQRDIIETESKLKHFKAELKKLGNVKLKALSEQFKQVGTKMQDAGKTLTQKLTVPLAAVGGASLKAGADFDTAMSQVAATSGKTVDEITDLRDFAKEMGATTAFSATQAAEGLNYMALAGYDAETSMAMLPTVLDLAASGAMELGAASDMVTDAQSALGLEIDETTVLVDQMAKASSTTNTSVSQLGEAILTVGGTAKMMKGGTQELTQVLGLLADNGIKGSEGGTALRNILLSLSAPTEKAAGAMEALGLEVFDSEGNMRSMQDIIADLGGALGKLTSEERTQMIAAIFNKRDIKSVNALLGTNAERWDEVGTAINNSSGAASQMADTQLDNMAGSLTLLKSSLEGAGIAISDVLAPYVKQLAEWIQELVQRFNELSPATQRIITIAGVIAAAIGPILVVLGVLVSSIGSIIGAVGKLGGVLTGLKTVATAVFGFIGTSGAVFLGVAAAVLALALIIYKNWDKIKAWTSALAKKVSAEWTRIKTNAVNQVNAMKQGIINAWNTIKSTASRVWNAIKNAIVTPIQSAKEKVKAIIDKVKSFFPIKVGNLLGHIKLPHFSISGSFSLKNKTVPKLSIDWYKNGGIFDSPSVIGVGEAGSEAVVPLDKFWDKLDKMQGGMNVVININSATANPKEIADEVKRALIREVKSQRLANGGI